MDSLKQFALLFFILIGISTSDEKSLFDFEDTSNVPGVYMARLGGYIFQCNGLANLIQTGKQSQNSEQEKEKREKEEYEPQERRHHGRSLRDSSTIDSEMHGDIKSILKIVEKVMREERNREQEEVENLRAQIDKLTKDNQHYKTICRDPCRAPFAMIEGRCIYIPRTQTNLTWWQAREECKEYGSDLIVFKDANEFTNIVHKLKMIFDDSEIVRRWIGATDIDEEGNWKWIDGRPMTYGVPFWGTRDNYVLEPSGGAKQNCAMIYSVNHFYVHDSPCDPQSDTSPICEYFP